MNSVKEDVLGLLFKVQTMDEFVYNKESKAFILIICHHISVQCLLNK